MDATFRGILYPAKLPGFHRLPAPPEVAALVMWFWIPEWDLAPGRTSRQELLSHPASNLVVQRWGVELAGPTTRVSHQDLSGRGWAVGALLKPAAVPYFATQPQVLRDARAGMTAPGLRDAVVRAMDGIAGEGDAQRRREHAVAEFAGWLAGRIPAVPEEALLANAMTDLIANSPELVQVGGVAKELAVSTRTLQRLAAKYVGLSPSALIRRRRLQEAADRARSQPELDLATIAAEFGYADQAHLANDFQQVLGRAPGRYRRTL